MRRRLFGTLCGLVFLMNFGRTVFAPLVTPLMASFDANEATVGLLVSLVWLGTAVPRIPMGYVLTRVPRHRVVLATGVTLGAASGLLAVADSLTTLRVATFALGVASGAYFVAAVPLVARLYPDAIGRSVGIHGAAAQLAAVLAPGVVTGVVLVASWRAVFGLLAVAAVVTSLVLAAVVRDSPSDDDGGTDRQFLVAVRANWRLILTGLVMVGVAGFTWQGLFNFYVTYLMGTKGLPASTANLLLTVVFAAGLPAFWYGGRFADRLPHVPYIIGILTGFVACVVALTRAAELYALVVVSVALGYLVHSLFPALDTYVLDSLPDESRGGAYAVFTGLSLLVEANGSGAVGVLTAAGYDFDAVFVALAALVGGVVVLLTGLYAGGRLPGSG